MVDLRPVEGQQRQHVRVAEPLPGGAVVRRVADEPGRDAVVPVGEGLEAGAKGLARSGILAFADGGELRSGRLRQPLHMRGVADRLAERLLQRGGVHDVAKLLDFGLVIHHYPVGDTSSDQKLTIQGTVLGSPPYISPEQARGKADIDARTDIYSLGGLGYFLLAGQPPFVRDSAMELLVAHINEAPPPLPPTLPPAVRAIVEQALQKNPLDRFATAAEMASALRAALRA